MTLLQILGVWGCVDLFVALILAYPLLEERHADGDPLHPIGTIVLCSLWPIVLAIFGMISLVSPGWIERREQRKIERRRRR